MSFLALHETNSSKSLSHQQSRPPFESSPDDFSHEPLSDVDLNSPPCSPPGTIKRKLQRKKSRSPSPSGSGQPRRPVSVRWPTGDPAYPSGSLSFDLSPPSSPQASPTKDKWAFLSSFKNESGSPTKSDSSRPLSALSDWFQGESAPINLGFTPNHDTDDETMDLRPSFLKRSSTLTGARSRSPVKSLASAGAARFGFLATAAKALSPTAASTPLEADEEDEFLQLDIKAALQPQGTADPFSPSSFKNLVQNAEGLLSRLQSAYQLRVAAVAEARAELSAQKEEIDETRTRAQHLKQQLNDLSAENSQKDEIINELLANLAREKKLREEEMEVRTRTIRVVDPTQKRSRDHRQSTGSSVVSDSGFESNNEEEEMGSSAYMTSSTTLSSAHSSPRVGHAHQTSVTKVSPTVVHNITAPTMESPMSELRTVNGDTTPTARPRAGECDNCSGVKPNAAWGLVSTLRDENSALKGRNKHLEGEMGAVLEMVNGLLGN